MTSEPISPELVLVDAELAARARAALSPPAVTTRAPLPAASPAAAPQQHDRRYPTWARITAALWLLVIGILVGGAAIPHAQDKPRVVPKDDDVVVTVCKPKPPQPHVVPGHLGGS